MHRIHSAQWPTLAPRIFTQAPGRSRSFGMRNSALGCSLQAGIESLQGARASNSQVHIPRTTTCGKERQGHNRTRFFKFLLWSGSYSRCLPMGCLNCSSETVVDTGTQSCSCSSTKWGKLGYNGQPFGGDKCRCSCYWCLRHHPVCWVACHSLCERKNFGWRWHQSGHWCGSLDPCSCCHCPRQGQIDVCCAARE